VKQKGKSRGEDTFGIYCLCFVSILKYLPPFLSHVNVGEFISFYKTVLHTCTSRRVRWVGHVALIGEMRQYFRWKPEEKRPLGRRRRRWEDNIRMDMREIGWKGVVWMRLAQGRDHWRALINKVMNLRVP
jgi:hypothetical protein